MKLEAISEKEENEDEALQDVISSLEAKEFMNIVDNVSAELLLNDTILS